MESRILLAKDGDWSRPPIVFDPDEVPLSAVVAVCRVGAVLDMFPEQDTPWHAWYSGAVELLDVRVLPKPVPCKGSQGLWRLPEDVHAAVAAQGVLRG